ncbi:uncharacterized protein LOC132751150 [Ruditapes philippinarum]|uniref:uncharacterized protein LOC132751150 n=1 Tax=Ruditapes philippinarum TaxID=129788 RepID=UPI00295C188C|nr:uncharacterized protein LOC132751150 [Ruditapes philippinarum]
MKILGWLITFTMIYSHCMCCEKSSRPRPYHANTAKVPSWAKVICHLYKDKCICTEIQNLPVKRSVRENTIEIIGDACDFHTYDSDGNGEITKMELIAIFKRHDLSQRLFQGMDNNKEDGVITFSEFYETAPRYIQGCWKEKENN